MEGRNMEYTCSHCGRQLSTDKKPCQKHATFRANCKRCQGAENLRSMIEYYCDKTPHEEEKPID